MVLVELDFGNNWPTSHEKHLLLPLLYDDSRITFSYRSKKSTQDRVVGGVGSLLGDYAVVQGYIL